MFWEKPSEEYIVLGRFRVTGEFTSESDMIEKQKCDYNVYIFTPSFTDLYAVAEVVDDAIKFPDKTLFCFFDQKENGEEFSKHQIKSLTAVGKMIENNKGTQFRSLKDLSEALTSG